MIILVVVVVVIRSWAEKATEWRHTSQVSVFALLYAVAAVLAKALAQIA